MLGLTSSNLCVTAHVHAEISVHAYAHTDGGAGAVANVGATGPDGSPAIPHNSRVKIRLQSWQEWWVDRVPAWIKYATIPEGEMGAKYNGVYWDPPRGERHVW